MSVLASPPFTPTMPNAWLEGSFLPHCGQEMSLPKTLGEGAGLAAKAGALDITAKTRKIGKYNKALRTTRSIALQKSLTYYII